MDVKRQTRTALLLSFIISIDSHMATAMPANEQKILSHLKDKGVITEGMSNEQIQKELNKYLGKLPKEPKPQKPPVSEKHPPSDLSN